MKHLRSKLKRGWPPLMIKTLQVIYGILNYLILRSYIGDKSDEKQKVLRKVPQNPVYNTKPHSRNISSAHIKSSIHSKSFEKPIKVKKFINLRDSFDPVTNHTVIIFSLIL